MEPRALELARVVVDVEAEGPPRLSWIVGPPSGRRVAVLPGSFNPPTDAHVALARAGRAAGMDAVVYLLSKRTVDKERVTGLELADRLLLLEAIAEPAWNAVAFGNVGLYVEQAEAFRRALPRISELAFLVGFDKIVQIFDPRYYDDRDAALRRLFALATFRVAPRGDAGEAELTALLERPENRPFAGGVQPLRLDERHRRASSTQVREGGTTGMPDRVRQFVDRWRPFDADGPYHERARALG